MKERKVGHQCGDDQPIGVAPEFINRFECYLERRGHKHSTRRAYLTAMKHFVYWLEARPRGKGEINHETIQIFLREHLPVCCCPKPVRKDIKTVRAALNQILLMEGHRRLRSVIHGASPKIEAAIERFDEYLRDVCGHSEATRWYHRRHVRTLLSWLIGNGPMALARITPATLCRFVTEQAVGRRPGSIGVLVYSLRTYLKFLQFTGYATLSLAATIPRPPNWSAASLPELLNSEELTLFLSVFNRSTAIGKRDYAMARCLTDLGLRCCEVADMELNAIDWRNGVLRLTKTKSRRQDTLPIPDTMGEALVIYLRYGRPETSSRAVFVHHRAPIGKAVQNSTVRGAVRRAFARAGLRWTGTHILRNTFAGRFFRAGATLKEIADVLRHRSIDTTKTYTKINLSDLTLVALPWPGRLS
jgi:site-specific recombinase XerD